MTAEQIEEQIIRIKQQVARLEQQIGDVKRNRNNLTQKHADKKRSIEAQTQYLRLILDNIGKLSRKLKELPQESLGQKKRLALEKQLAERQYNAEEEAKLKPLHDEYAITGDKLLEAKTKYEELALELAREKTVLEQKNQEAAEQLVREQEKIPTEIEQLARAQEKTKKAAEQLAHAQEKNRQVAAQRAQTKEVQKTLDQIKPLPPYSN